jgi:adenylate cyclase
MNERWKERFRKWSAVSPVKITIGILIIALALFIEDVTFLRFMELKALDLRMVSRGQIASGGETIIVTIDEKSLSELGRWPWPRTVIARLVEQLKVYGIKAVGFDIVFSEPDENVGLKTITELSREVEKSGIQDAGLKQFLAKKKSQANTDAVLANAIAKVKNVTLGYFFHTSEKDAQHLTPEEINAGIAGISNARYQMIQAAKNVGEHALIHAFAPVSNIEALTKSAENSGYFNAFPDSDGVIRWAPLVVKCGEDYYSPLSLSLLLQYLDWPMLSIKLADFGVESIRLENLVIPTDETGRLLINYLGPAKSFPHYSISDILYGRLSPDLFKDKIAIVGATATGIYDLRVTPFSAVYPGVEIHATVIDNILHQNFLIQSGWTKFVDLCLIIVLGAVVGIVIPRARATMGMLLILIMLVVFVGTNAFLFSRFNLWLNLIYPTLTMMTIYLAITVYRYITEEREKKKIRSAFQYYLTASVITEMLKDPTKLKLGGDKKNLTVLFSDIRGFTTVSEKLSPEELVHLLNEYLTAMTDIVFQYDGLLDKYMGDAIMAVYGAPLDQPDHPARACRTALDMLKALKGLQKKWAEEGRPVLNIGVGINSGEMVVGNMGSQMRFDYTVMGDSVNLGSRLEGINKEYGTNIVISEYTYDAVKDILLCRELDSVRVKGKHLPVKIYELLCEKKDAEPYEAFLRLFDEGLEKYKQAQWDDAIAVFKRALEIKPGDPPSELYIRRCEDLKEHPPPEPWDGVFTMTKK